MKRELLAIVQGCHEAPEGTDLHAARHGGFTVFSLPRAPRWLVGPALRSHRLRSAPDRQRKLESLMPLGTVLPFVPGATVDEDDLDCLLDVNLDMLSRLSDRMHGLVQYQVTVDWLEDKVLDRFRDAPEIAPLFSASSVSAEGVRLAVGQLAERLQAGLRSALATIATELSELPRTGATIANHVIMLPSSVPDRLDDILAEFDAVWPEGLRIRLIGPGPGTAFAALRVQRFASGDIEGALACLGLGEGATTGAIREARQLLLRRFPSRADEIRQAARLAGAASGRDRTRPIIFLEVWTEGSAAPSLMEEVA